MGPRDTEEVQAYDILGASYGALLPVVTALDDETGWRSTRCRAWTARDLVHHLLGDAQRALVALHTPAAGDVDVDAVTYWQKWQPETLGADAGRRGTRIMASAWSRVGPLAELYAETARAVLVAARERSAADVVATQRQVITVGDLLSTLAVEATVHHLDLDAGAPSRPGLSEVRRVLDGLLGRPSPVADDIRYILIATGREAPSEEERNLLGGDTKRLPLFG